VVGQSDASGRPQGRDWEPMTLRYVGEVGEVLQQGGGKLSPSPFDPGETFKPPGQG
jgi:hypothetical protein